MNSDLSNDLIRAVYEAALDPVQWGVFLGKFACAVGSPSVAFLLQDLRDAQGSAEAHLGFDPVWERRYADYFGKINVWMERAPHLFRPGIIVCSHHVVGDGDLVKTEFYNDFLRPQDHFYSYGAILGEKESVISAVTAMRSRADGPFASREVELLRELTPHLQMALKVHDRLSALELRADGLTEAMDHVPQGVLLVDFQARVRFANRYAEDLLHAGDGLRAPNKRLAASGPDETERLHAMIADAAACRGGRLAGGVMSVSRGGYGRDLSLTVVPFAAGGERRRPTVIVFVADPQREPRRKARVLEELLGITAAEARVVKALVEGKSPAEIADETATSMNTVRSHLKQVFAKTGVRRQSELVRLVMTVSPSGR